MKQFTSHLDFFLTKKRLLMMGKRISGIKVGAIWLFVLPVSVASVIVLSAQPDNYPETMSIQEIWDSMPPTTYYDMELTFYGDSRYHYLDDRRGVWKDTEGIPYSGPRSQYYINTDQKIMTELFKNGRIIQQNFFLSDSTDNVSSQSLVEFSISEQDELISTVTTYFQTDSAYQSMIISEYDSTRNYKMYYRSGQLLSEWNVLVDYETPDLIKFGLQTYYEEDGTIGKQERFENGELIEKIK